MLNFKTFLRLEDLIENISDETMEFLDILCEEDVPYHDDPKLKSVLAKHKVPKPTSEKEVWRRVRKGAQSYFSKTPEEQRRTQRAASSTYGRKQFTDEKSNPKLAKNKDIFSGQGSNTKLKKSGKKIPHYKTLGLFISPAKSSGHEVCHKRSKECTAACLGDNSGRGRMKNTRTARKNRAMHLFNHPEHFYANLDREITKAKGGK